MDSIFHPLGGQRVLVDIYLLPYYLSDQEPQSGGESYAHAVTFYSILYFSVYKCKLFKCGFLYAPEGMNAEKSMSCCLAIEVGFLWGETSRAVYFCWHAAIMVQVISL